MNVISKYMPLIFGFIYLSQMIEMKANPNHLEPVPAYDLDGYDQAVFSSFIGKRRPALWMIVKPSFESEYAIILDRGLEPGQWNIEYAVAKRSIWRWKKIDSGARILDIHPTNEIEKHCLIVPDNFACQIKNAWLSVLKQTRYPIKDYRALDGVVYQFYCEDYYFGEIWSPTSGIPKMLSDLGLGLRDLAKSQDSERNEIQKKCLELVNEIIAQTKLKSDTVND